LGAKSCGIIIKKLKREKTEDVEKKLRIKIIEGE
jgi:hypothetical protein